MSSILSSVQKLEAETRGGRRAALGRVAVAGISLLVALTLAYAVVAGLTSSGVLGS